MKIDKEFCISSYLELRYVARPDVAWESGVIPEFPDVKQQGTFKVTTPPEVYDRLQQIVRASFGGEDLGVLLSAGMDSAIIAAMLPRGTRAYTVRFVAPDAIDEAPAARHLADTLGLRHTVVDVTWSNYHENMDLLMKRKRSPLHPAEVGLYMAACAASKDGIKTLAVGNGADSTFGGMDKLLSLDWTFDEFIRRYTFLDSARAVQKPVPMLDIFKPYRRGAGVDTSGFLKTVHGLGIIQMFENAIRAGGCALVAPFEQLALDVPLDLARIRAGEPKYILSEVFRRACPKLELPPKIAFARPVGQWLAGWHGPRHAIFRTDVDWTTFSGEQRWQLFCLERFLNLLDSGGISE